MTLYSIRRFATLCALEIAFWAPFLILPLVAGTMAGYHYDYRKLAYVFCAIVALAIVGAYFSRFFVTFRLFIFVVLGVGAFFAIGITIAGLGAPTTDMMLAVIDSDAHESTEFVKGYFGTSAYLLEAALLIPLISLFVQRRTKMIWQLRNLIPVALLVCALAIRISFLHGSLMTVAAQLPEPIPVYFTFAAAFQKRAEILAIGKDESPIAGVTVAKPQHGPRTYVVVIGESESKYHMHLYDYNRQTTPHLDKLAASNDLLVFTNAVTPHAATVPALTDVLTVDVGPQHERRTIFQILKAAGIKTYWLSNQSANTFNSIQTVSDNAVALLSYSASVHKWVRLNRDGRQGSVSLAQKYSDLDRSYQLDGALLPFLRDVLFHKHEDKVVFVHLIGNHYSYRLRYPSEENSFTNLPDGDCLSQTEARLANDYDNSVHYNDFILNEIIEATRKAGGDSLVLYLSDHGEEIYEFRNYFGHFDERLSPFMAEVPMVLWLSPAFKKIHPEATASVTAATKQPIWTGDLSYALVDLVGVGFPGADSSRSIFSEEFMARTRVTGDRDYDAFKASWRPDVAHANGYALNACARSLRSFAVNAGR